MDYNASAANVDANIVDRVNRRSQPWSVYNLGHTGRYARHTAQTYRNALIDPFSAPVSKLGFGTFCPTALHSGWKNQTFLDPTVTCFAVVSAPVMYGNSSGLPGFLQYYKSTNPASTIGAGFAYNQGPANLTVLQATAQTARVVSYGLRVTVQTPATQLPGRIGAIYLPDDSTASLLSSTTYQGVENLAGYRQFHPTAGGSNGGQVAYRPFDMTSFEFVAKFAQSSYMADSTSVPQLVVVGTGWPADNFSVVASVYCVWETLGGLDASGDDDYSPSQLTADAAVNVSNNLPPPVTPSLSAIDLLDNAFNNVARSQARYGMTMGTLRGLRSQSLGLNDSGLSSSSSSSSGVPPRESYVVIDTTSGQIPPPQPLCRGPRTF